MFREIAVTRAGRHSALREKLISIGAVSVAEAGLAGLKAREIASQAGCALGAIYLVFPDLDALILAINDRTLAAIDAAIQGTSRGSEAHDTDPARQLVSLADAYLDYALAQPRLWAALFLHSLPPGRTVPDEYRARQARLFAYVEQPLSRLRPELAGPELALTARSLFSAVHGVVALGLDQKLGPVPVDHLKDQLHLLVRAMADGLRGVG